jgi:hypothetical protein
MSNQGSAPEPIREPLLGSIVTWLVLIGSFGLSSSTWIALAELAGWTDQWSIGGTIVKLAWLMPTVVDGYLVAALVLWMAPVSVHIAEFAKKNTYGSAAIGIGAQAAYHALLIWSTTGVAWRAVLACIVGSLPPLFAGLAVHMRALVRRESRKSTAPVLPVVAEPAPATVPVPTEVPVQKPAPATPMTLEPAPQDRPRRYPTSDRPAVTASPHPELPAPKRPPLTRSIGEEFARQHPDLNKQELAKLYGVTDRRWRYVMNGEPVGAAQ